jgi:ACS family glucarate transporter-like MFS transporter
MRIRYPVLALLVLLSVITYMDRVCISVASTRIKSDLSISDEYWGWVLGAFVLSYGLFEIPSGAWGDRVGQRRILTRIVVWWSLFTVLTGMATSYVMLVVVRFLFGAGEAGAYPNATGSIGRWFPAAERARAQGFVWGASRLGGAITPLLLVPLMATIGWRSAFFLFGAAGIVWAIAWRIWYRDDPAQHAAVTPAELAEIGPDRSRLDHHSIPWDQLFRSRQLWLIMAMYACYVWGSMFYITWLPEYLTKGRGLSEGEMSVFAAIPFLMGACGNLMGGFASDRLTRTWGPKVGRRLVGSVCLALSALCLLGTALTGNKYLAAAFLAVGFLIMDGMLPCAWAMCVDVGQRYAGAVSGAMNSAGQAGGFVCTVLFGYLTKWYQDYNLPMLVIAGMVLVSSGLFCCIDPSRRLLPAPTSPSVEAPSCA